MRQNINDAYGEIESRIISCGRTLGYPFSVDARSSTITMHVDDSDKRHLVYQYLLLATRLQNGASYRFANINGTDFFEELCAQIGKSYLGDRASSSVFGASSGGRFRRRVVNLISCIGEGSNARESISPSTKDGNLDVVVWKPFADGIPRKLILFGQCKTGTSYRDSVTQLQPDQFCQKYFTKQSAIKPARAFFVSEALPRNGTSSRDRWYEFVVDSGLLFDRCRIIDYCDSIADTTLEKLHIWTFSAVERFIQSPSLGR